MKEQGKKKPDNIVICHDCKGSGIKKTDQGHFSCPQCWGFGKISK